MSNDRITMDDIDKYIDGCDWEFSCPFCSHYLNNRNYDDLADDALDHIEDCESNPDNQHCSTCRFLGSSDCPKLEDTSSLNIFDFDEFGCSDWIGDGL